MKHKYLIGGMLIIYSLALQNVNAQLKVESTGNVTITKRVGLNGATVVDSIGLNVKVPVSTSFLRTYGIYSSISSFPYSQTGYGCRVGVFGEITPEIVRADLRDANIVYSPFQAGVAGIAAKGVGVYGSTSTPLPRIWTAGTFAGYFNGNVKVTGSVTATSVNTTSDSRLKTNISSLNSNEVMTVLGQLRPVSYTLRNDSNNILFVEDAQPITHYGLIAQELQNILPELVHQDGSGYMSVNYIELIPLLIESLKLQQSQITAMQQQLIELQEK